MKKIEDYDFGPIYINITNENTEYIIINIHNKSKTNISTTLNGSRYISVRNGILGLYSTEPSEFCYSSGVRIKSGASVNIKMFFPNLDNYIDGDRIELKVKDFVNCILIREKGEWFFFKNISNLHIEENIKKLIQQFEVIENRLGISLQEFNVKVKNYTEIELSCKIQDISRKVHVKYFSIEVGIYDKKNKIVYYTNIRKDKTYLLNSENINIDSIYLPIPVTSIGKIIIYPTKN